MGFRPKLLLMLSLACIIASFPPCCFGASSPDYQVLSLEDCLALARKENPVLGASREKIQELAAD